MYNDYFVGTPPEYLIIESNKFLLCELLFSVSQQNDTTNLFIIFILNTDHDDYRYNQDPSTCPDCRFQPRPLLVSWLPFGRRMYSNSTLLLITPCCPSSATAQYEIYIIGQKDLTSRSTWVPLTELSVISNGLHRQVDFVNLSFYTNGSVGVSSSQ